MQTSTSPLSITRLHGFSLYSVALALAALASVGSAQETQPAISSLTVNARLVVLDVVVTDANGKPVDNLDKLDFQVFEDGKLQQIRSLEPPSEHILPVSTASSATASDLTEVFDPAKPANFGRSPVTILVLDQLNTHFADSSFARKQLQAYLTRQPALLPNPTCLFNVSDGRLDSLHVYTRDRDALLKALASAPVKYAWRLEIDGKAEHGPIDRLDQSLRALEQIAQASARIPGRKNLVWVGGGFPAVDPTIVVGKDLQEVKDTLHHLTDVMLDLRMTLYAIDPSSTAAGMSEIITESQQAFADAAGDSFAGNADPFDSDESFDQLGKATGGRVVRGLNDVSAQIASSVDLGTHFYTIAYTPTSVSESAAPFRSIRVVVLRPGLKATTRSGYYAGPTIENNTAATATYDLTAAAESPIPLNGLQVGVVPDRSINAPPHTYLIQVAAPGLTWKRKDDGGSSASVYILAVSLNSGRKMVGHTLHGMSAFSKPNIDLRDPARTAEFVFTAPPTAKSTTLRFIVRDSISGRMGSVDLPVSSGKN